jgi:hypothetical protein
VTERVQKALVVCLDGVRHDVLESGLGPGRHGAGWPLTPRLAPTSRISKERDALNQGQPANGDYGPGVPAEAGTVPAPLRWKVSG